jgi:hypothetical protein
MKQALVATLLLLSLAAGTSALAQQPVAPLSPQQRQELNVYFTSLTEARLPGFAQGRLPYEVMLEFALQHCLAKYSDGLKHIRDGSIALVPATLADRVTDQFFGTTLQKHMRSEYPVHKWEPDALRFAQVTDLRPMGGDRYRAEGVLYVAALDEGVDQQAAPESWAKAGKTVERAGTFAATLRRAESPSGGRYILIEYLVTAEQSAYVDEPDFEQMLKDEGVTGPWKKRPPRPATQR